MDECVLWTGTTQGHGYGVLWKAGRLHLVHRLAFKLAHGYLPPVIHHRCGTRQCINPEHLEPKGSQAEHAHGHTRTKCRYGHDWSIEANVYFDPRTGARSCRVCRAIRNKGGEPWTTNT